MVYACMYMHKSPHTHSITTCLMSSLSVLQDLPCHDTILHSIYYTMVYWYIILLYHRILYYIVQILIVALKGPFKGPPPQTL